VPWTPRQGATTALALTEDVKARRNNEAVKDLESISKKNNEWTRVSRICKRVSKR